MDRHAQLNAVVKTLPTDIPITVDRSNTGLIPMQPILIARVSIDPSFLGY